MSALYGALATTLAVYRYPIIFLAVIAEGPVIMLGSGVLLRLGNFDLVPLFLTLLIGDLVADVVWYFVGLYAAEPFLKRFGHIFGVTHEVFEKMEGVFRRHDVKILFISKITMGFGFALATLIAAGAVRVPFRKYILLNLFGGFLWTSLLMAAGYFFGNLYFLLDKGIRDVFFVAMAIIAVLALYKCGAYMKKKYAGSYQKSI